MIPDQNDARWRKLLTTESDISAASLATRILVSRLRREVVQAPASLMDKVAELRGFFAKNTFAVADIAKF